MTALRSRVIVISLAAAALGSFAAAQQVPPPRGAPLRPQSGTAILSGVVVTDEARPVPVRRATVTVHVPGDARSIRTIATDDAGRFRFSGLPAGNVTLYVAKPGFVTSYYGAKKPGSTLGVPIAVGDGTRTENLTVRIIQGAVVTGVIANPAGRPMPNVSVRLQRVTLSPLGRRTLAPAGGPPPQPSDDRGVYRAFGLPPGEYVVSAQPRVAGPFGTGADELVQPTADEIRWAEREIAGAQPGRAGGATRPAAASATSGRPVTVAYAIVFHPGVVAVADATPVRVEAGQERAGVDIRTQFVPTSRIEGRVVDSTGQPAAGYTVSILHRSMPGFPVDVSIGLLEAGLLSAGGAVRVTQGGFSVQGVQPGQYTLLARTPARQDTPAMSAVSDIEVAGRDIDGLVLTLAPGVTVSGTLAFSDAAPATPPRLMVRLAPVQATGPTLSAAVAPSADGAFTIAGVLPGFYRLTVVALTSGTPSWALESAMLDGRDVSDQPFEIKAGQSVPGLAITLTGSAAELTGVLYDSGGQPTSDLSIIVFPADRARWFQGSRFLRAPVRPASDGKFSFPQLAPGEYRLAALTDFDANDWFDPEFLEQVVPGAMKITIVKGEKKVQDLKIGIR